MWRLGCVRWKHWSATARRNHVNKLRTAINNSHGFKVDPLPDACGQHNVIIRICLVPKYKYLFLRFGKLEHNEKTRLLKLGLFSFIKYNNKWQWAEHHKSFWTPDHHTLLCFLKGNCNNVNCVLPTLCHHQI